MRNNLLPTLVLLAVALAGISVNASAQKKGKAARIIRKAEPKEDYSLYVDNPVSKVMIVDSIVVNADDVLLHIPMPRHLGSFAKDDDGNRYHQNDFEDQRLYAAVADTAGNHCIYRKSLVGDKWSEPEPLRINGTCYDFINPFPMPDGQTLYFAARNEDDHEGRCYSLYTTTLDYETGEYLAPSRLPFPFASGSDDLFFIEDDVSSIAWFVTRRRQPEGKACIYTIHSQQPWEYYDAEETAPQRLKSYALIDRIADTWGSTEQRNVAMEQMKSSLNEYREEENANAHQGNEPQARRHLRMKAETLQRQIDEYRRMYASSKDSRMAETIRQAETELRQIYASMRAL